MALANTRFFGSSCIGEIKGEDQKNDNHKSVVDLVRIGLMSRDSINKNCNKGILGVHVVGKKLLYSNNQKEICKLNLV
jgi:hypothetical protein